MFFQKFDLLTHVTNSMYELFISDWLAVFPRKQFLFIRLEDYNLDRAGYTKALADFLELSKIDTFRLLNIVLTTF